MHVDRSDLLVCSFCFMSWCLKFFCAVGAICMFSYLYPRHLCRRVYSFRFSVRMFVGSLVCSLFRNVRGIYVKVFVKVSLVVYIS